MNATHTLHDIGQSLWLDNITRDLVSGDGLRRYITEFSVTGLTSNPSIFDHALSKSHAYDDAIRRCQRDGLQEEALFFALALDDLTKAADQFAPVHRATDGVDGWVSLEVSPLLAHDTDRTVGQARELHGRAQRDNLFIKIPGTREGVAAIENAIFAGVPVNVTLLFSRDHYLAASEAYMRGLERRLAAGLGVRVASVASLFVSRWDKATLTRVPARLRNHLGIAVAKQTYQAYCATLASPRWKRLEHAGARPQRLLWASTATKDPEAPDVLYIEALAAKGTINTMPDETLRAFADHGRVSGVLSPDGGDAGVWLKEFADAGIDVPKLAETLQDEGAAAFTASWKHLMETIRSRSAALQQAGA